MMDREGMQSRIITGIGEIRIEKTVDPTEHPILQIETYTNHGTLVLRFSQGVAMELTALLKTHPLTRAVMYERMHLKDCATMPQEIDQARGKRMVDRFPRLCAIINGSGLQPVMDTADGL